MDGKIAPQQLSFKVLFAQCSSMLKRQLSRLWERISSHRFWFPCFLQSSPTQSMTGIRSQQQLSTPAQQMQLLKAHKWLCNNLCVGVSPNYPCELPMQTTLELYLINEVIAALHSLMIQRLVHSYVLHTYVWSQANSLVPRTQYCTNVRSCPYALHCDSTQSRTIACTSQLQLRTSHL